MPQPDSSAASSRSFERARRALRKAASFGATALVEQARSEGDARTLAQWKHELPGDIAFLREVQAKIAREEWGRAYDAWNLPYSAARAIEARHGGAR